jgi:hypothetical protein
LAKAGTIKAFGKFWLLVEVAVVVLVVVIELVVRNGDTSYNPVLGDAFNPKK